MLAIAPFDHLLTKKQIKKGLHFCNPFIYMVARPGIEPGTQGFSIPCSTD